ncbi:MAG: glycosyltransferase [Synechococcus sp.]
MPHKATLAICGSLLLVALVAVAWALGEPTISGFFAAWDSIELNPPSWVRPPQGSLLDSWLPVIVLVGSAQLIMVISPRPQRWSRSLVVMLMLAAIGRYTLWRILASLNLVGPSEGIFSLILFGMEMAVIASAVLRLVLMFGIRSRSPEADRMAEAVLSGAYLPSVDVLIPTYNEPATILRRTVIGCQALDYPNKQVYLLDDGKRAEIRQLAQQLGCHYIARPSNIHAKAGNINHALGKTGGDLIAIFDADFVPTSNFLLRTVGFFQDRTTGLVQTQQGFYNPDPVARNLGLEKVLPPEVEIFSRHYQPLRDTNETSICYGSSFVVRRSALEDIDGFVTESLSEDYFTGISLSAKGDRTIYLDEVLSSGLCAENMTGHILQRQRWARGTIQAFFLRCNPLTLPGFNLMQRLSHLEGISQWFFSLFRVLFLLMPMIYVLFGTVPLRTSVMEGLYFFLPFYLLNLTTFSWLNDRSRSALVSDIYEVAQCIPVSIVLVKALFKPFAARFKVTPKGVSRDRHIYNWEIAWPLIVLWLMSAITLLVSLNVAYGNGYSFFLSVPDNPHFVEGMKVAWIWSAYNIFVLSIALVIMRDVPKPDLNEWFDRCTPVQLRVGSRTLEAMTRSVSEVGAEVELRGRVDGIQSAVFRIPETSVLLDSSVLAIEHLEHSTVLHLRFDRPTHAQFRALVEFLFCRPGHFKGIQVPNELGSLLILMKIFVSPITWGIQKTAALVDRQRITSTLKHPQKQLKA